MIKVSVFYPNKEGSKFDLDYYCNIHIPMAQQKLGTALKGFTVESGLSGGVPGSQATYIAIGHFLFTSPEAFYAASGPVAEELQGDIPNYMDISPIIQISEVRISQ